MKRVFVYLFPVCLAVWLCGCATHKDATVIRDESSLARWVQPQDSANVSKNNASDIKTKENNLKRLQYDVDKEKNNPYVGEHLYHFFRDLFKR